jgi:hypothetical protein
MQRCVGKHVRPAIVLLMARAALAGAVGDTAPAGESINNDQRRLSEISEVTDSPTD